MKARFEMWLSAGSESEQGTGGTEQVQEVYTQPQPPFNLSGYKIHLRPKGSPSHSCRFPVTCIPGKEADVNSTWVYCFCINWQSRQRNRKHTIYIHKHFKGPNLLNKPGDSQTSIRSGFRVLRCMTAGFKTIHHFYLSFISNTFWAYDISLGLVLLTFSAWRQIMKLCAYHNVHNIMT